MDISECLNRIEFSIDADSRRDSVPRPTDGLVFKWFKPAELVQAHQEASAYSRLRKLQGELIPCCYGPYELGERPGLGLLLEKVNGDRLDERLQQTEEARLQQTEELDAYRALYLRCFRGLTRLHEAGLVHGDVNGGNILIDSDSNSCILIDFERSRWVDSVLLSSQLPADYGEPGLWMR